jgi:hypothetical protein
MPWIARNKSVTDHFVLGTGGGYNLWLGNHIPTKGLDHDELAAKEVIKLDNTINKIAINQDPFSVESSKQFTKEAIQEAYIHPLKTLFLIGKKSLRFWFHIYHPTHKKYGYLLIPIECGLIFFSIIGIYFSFKHGLHISPFLISILYFNIIHAILISTFRYSIPIHPIIIILFSYVILITKQKFSKSCPQKGVKKIL